MKSAKIEISVKTILIISGLVASVFIFQRISDILVMLLVAFIFKTAVTPLVSSLQRLRFPRILAVLTVYLILICALVVAIAVIVPPLIDQTTKLFTRLNIPHMPALQQISSIDVTRQDFSSLVNQLGVSVGTIFSVVTSTFSLLFSIFTMFVISLYMLIGQKYLLRLASHFFQSEDKENRAAEFIANIDRSLGSWVRGEFTLMITIGVMTYLGLLLLGIPYALPLAILAGFLEALPNIGPTLAAIPAVVVAFLIISPIMGGVTAVLYMLIQAVENNVIVPQVMRNAIGINPLVSIVLILTGVRFGGVMGAFLVLPLFIIVRVIVKDFRPELSKLLNA